jgi:branched-chain amino acid transport system permease protein
MSTFILLTATGLGLAALYFLVAAGLSLIFGLADVLNFAHGLFLSVGAYATWWAAGNLPGAGPDGRGFLVAIAFGVLAGTAAAIIVELVLIRPLYLRSTEQILATVGLSLAGVAALQTGFGTDPRSFPQPAWTQRVIHIAGAAIPSNRLVLIAAAGTVLGGLAALLRYSRFGLVVRAGVEDREMVTALGIDVGRTFTAVFAVGGAAAALGGGLSGVYFGAITPELGSSLLITAIIIVVIGGMGSISGTAIAAVLVGLIQQYANYYGALGLGDVCVIALLAVMLLLRPQGITGRKPA